MVHMDLKFVALAFLAVVFVIAAAAAVMYLQGQGSAPPKCEECQYLSQGKCFDYECCNDADCSVDQTCAGHVCYPLNCVAGQTAKNHKCVETFENGSVNVSEYGCDSSEECGANESCVDRNCTPLQCASLEVISNHTCTEGECAVSEDCNATAYCFEYKCFSLFSHCRGCYYIENHTCRDYECCDYYHCGEGQICTNHTCVNKTCPTGQNLFAGQCVRFACFNDSECNDNNANTVDSCTDPGSSFSECQHNWVIVNFTGNTTLSLYLNQTAAYAGKDSKITLLAFRNSSGVVWCDRAFMDYSLWSKHETDWVLTKTDCSGPDPKFWKEFEVNGETLTIKMKSISTQALTATFEVLYVEGT
jgi:hypothetical protein